MRCGSGDSRTSLPGRRRSCGCRPTSRAQERSDRTRHCPKSQHARRGTPRRVRSDRSRRAPQRLKGSSSPRRRPAPGTPTDAGGAEFQPQSRRPDRQPRRCPRHHLVRGRPSSDRTELERVHPRDPPTGSPPAPLPVLFPPRPPPLLARTDSARSYHDAEVRPRSARPALRSHRAAVSRRSRLAGCPGRHLRGRPGRARTCAESQDGNTEHRNAARSPRECEAAPTGQAELLTVIPQSFHTWKPPDFRTMVDPQVGVGPCFGSWV